MRARSLQTLFISTVNCQIAIMVSHVTTWDTKSYGDTHIAGGWGKMVNTKLASTHLFIDETYSSSYLFENNILHTSYFKIMQTYA